MNQSDKDDFDFRVVLGRAYRGLTGGFLLLWNFSVGISVSPHVCFILVGHTDKSGKVFPQPCQRVSEYTQGP